MILEERKKTLKLDGFEVEKEGVALETSFEWPIDVAMVDAVLKSSMDRTRQRSQMCPKQERESLKVWLEKERRIKSNTQDCEQGHWKWKQDSRWRRVSTTSSSSTIALTKRVLPVKFQRKTQIFFHEKPKKTQIMETYLCVFLMCVCLSAGMCEFYNGRYKVQSKWFNVY